MTIVILIVRLFSGITIGYFLASGIYLYDIVLLHHLFNAFFPKEHNAENRTYHNQGTACQEMATCLYQKYSAMNSVRRTRGAITFIPCASRHGIPYLLMSQST